MFFIDKYAPKSINSVYFHKEELQKLKTMSQDESIPHLIFYGPDGSGKKSIINMFLEMVYDKHVHNLSDTIYTVTGSGNITTQVTIKQSNYHIVIEPNNNNFDRYLIQDIVKEYARRVPLNVFTAKKVFKTVLINNIDNLSYYAQTSLRRTMEKYSKTCRFIMWSRSLSKVIEPLRSRCYCLRIKAPTDSELMEMLLDISIKENMKVSLNQYTDIICMSQRNAKKALWLLELLKFNEPIETTYDEVVNDIVDNLITTDLELISNIRELLYKIMITNINGTHIVKDITDKLLENERITYDCKMKIAELAASFEHNLIRGRREIIHLEAFVTGIMNILHFSNLYGNKKSGKNKKMVIKN
jgi:replication factor C subunit 3/5